MQEINLTTSLQYLKGVGPERSKVFARLGLHTVKDLLHFYPRRYENRFPVKRISELIPGEKQCVRGVVTSRGLIRRKFAAAIFKIVLQDEKDRAVLFAVYFNQPYLSKVFTPKSEVVLYGVPEREGRHLQMVHPDYEIVPARGDRELVHNGRIVPVYPLTEDLSQKGLRSFAHRAVSDLCYLIKDSLPLELKKRLMLVDRAPAIKNIHFPESDRLRQRAYRRLVFDEFFSMQLLVQLHRAELQKQNKAISHGDGQNRLKAFLEGLPVELTGAQRSSIDETIKDMKKDRPMSRLIQGDVGSGKTFVAASALVFTVANGFQGAMMAPTETLAQQLFFNLSQSLEPHGISCAYLSGDVAQEDKREILQKLESGDISVICGTHALIQKNVKFKKLGLVIIDEQHKFGVFQRAALKEKSGSETPHFLLMTATPIPRTLALTLYGDLDISTIGERPLGRLPVKTMWVNEERRKEIYALLDESLEKGGQAFVICPRIDESGEFSLKSVTEAHQELSQIFSHRKVALLHGRMKGPEKKKLMQDFKEKKIQLLISTVVIEVGIDVPNANFMIIENAERFGLSQLHQLRGRVGRGGEEAICVLFSETTNPETRERLEAFQEMDSGFEVAEKDLEIRGAGDIIGERQHGFPELKIGDLSKDLDILVLAKKEAAAIIEKDPVLAFPEHQALKRAIRGRFRTLDEKKPAVWA